MTEKEEKDRILAEGINEPFWIELQARIDKLTDPRQFYILPDTNGKGGYWHTRGMHEGLNRVVAMVKSAHKATIRNTKSTSDEK